MSNSTPRVRFTIVAVLVALGVLGGGFAGSRYFTTRGTRVATLAANVGALNAEAPVAPATPVATSPLSGAESTTPLATAEAAPDNANAFTGGPAPLYDKPVGLGFNNSEQVVDAGEGTQMVWVQDGNVVLATRSATGAVVDTTTVYRRGRPATLAAITASGKRVAVGWTLDQSVYAAVSEDRGKTFGETVNLGEGKGLSLAASGDRLVGVWHSGSEGSTSRIQIRTFSGKSWSKAVPIDDSTAAALWAAVDVYDDHVFAAWRDNSTGPYIVKGRRSTDGGRTWGAELSLTSKLSGDPDVCLTANGDIWVAHHGLGKISLLHSTDGTNFTQPIAVGRGFFAHLSCNKSIVALAWEASTEGPRSRTKRAGYAVYSDRGKEITSGEIDDGAVAGTTIHASESGTVELLWVKTGSRPLFGTLQHQVLSLKAGM